MDVKKKEAIMECTSFDELLDAEYGERGTEARENFEVEAEAFCLASVHQRPCCALVTR